MFTLSTADIYDGQLNSSSSSSSSTAAQQQQQQGTVAFYSAAAHACSLRNQLIAHLHLAVGSAAASAAGLYYAPLAISSL
jgi:hypothetical protein